MKKIILATAVFLSAGIALASPTPSTNDSSQTTNSNLNPATPTNTATTQTTQTENSALSPAVKTSNEQTNDSTPVVVTDPEQKVSTQSNEEVKKHKKKRRHKKRHKKQVDSSN